MYKQDWTTLPPPPYLFYVDLNIPESVKYTYQKIPQTEASKELYNLVKDIPYIFVHQKCSVSSLPLVRWNIDEIFTIDPDTNLYHPSSPFYPLAQKFVGKNIFDYTLVIQNALQVHMIDSSFSCLGLYCKPMKATVKHCYMRNSFKEIVGWFDTY
jgi:hypothetical protein